MTDPSRADGTSGPDLDGWTEVLPDDDEVNALGWREVRGALWIVAIGAVAFIVAGVVVL